MKLIFLVFLIAQTAVFNHGTADCFSYGLWIEQGTSVEWQIKVITDFYFDLKTEPDCMNSMAMFWECDKRQFVLVDTPIYTSEPIYFTDKLQKNKHRLRRAIRGFIEEWTRRMPELRR